MAARKALAPPSPDAYVIFPRMIVPEQAAGLLQAILAFMNGGAQHICVSFSSIGGGVPAAFSLYNNLRSLPVHLRMHNIGQVASAANVVFLAGEERTASPRATFMFHAPTLEVQAGTELDETLLMQHAKDLAASDIRTRDVVTERTKMTAAKIDELKRGQNTVNTAEAKRLGLIERVVDLKIPSGAPSIVV